MFKTNSLSIWDILQTRVISSSVEVINNTMREVSNTTTSSMINGGFSKEMESKLMEDHPRAKLLNSLSIVAHH